MCSSLPGGVPYPAILPHSRERYSNSLWMLAVARPRLLAPTASSGNAWSTTAADLLASCHLPKKSSLGPAAHLLLAARPIPGLRRTRLSGSGSGGLAYASVVDVKLRPPECTVLYRSIERIWFLLPHGQFHRRRQTPASAPRSTGVSALRGTPGERGERGEIDRRVQVAI